MKAQDIEFLLKDMMKLAGDDPCKIYHVWECIDNLYQFFSEIDSDIYHDDPMSDHAPSECFGLHMKPWRTLELALEVNLRAAKVNYDNYMNEQPDFESLDYCPTCGEESKFGNRCESCNSIEL